MAQESNNAPVRYSDEELQEFKELITRKLEEARSQYAALRKAITHSISNDPDGDTPNFNPIEDGAASLAREEASVLAQRQYKFIQSLEAALVRIEQKTYGICRVTGQLIPRERLMLVPHATTTVEAKEQLNRR